MYSDTIYSSRLDLNSHCYDHRYSNDIQTMGNNDPKGATTLHIELSADREGLGCHVTKRNPENDGVHGFPEGAVQHSNESNDTRSQPWNAKAPDRSCKNPALSIKIAS